MVESKQYNIDKTLYEKAYTFSMHLSYVVYVLFGFFLYITGWYLKADLTPQQQIFGIDNPQKYMSLLFLSLLVMMAKVSRLSSDNQMLMSTYEDKYTPSCKFNGTGLKGIGDFVMYFLCSSITMYFIAKSLPLDFNVGIILLLFLFIFTYYGLADGDCIISLYGEKPHGMADIIFQIVAYLFVFCLITIILIGSLQISPFTAGMKGGIYMVIDLGWGSPIGLGCLLAGIGILFFGLGSIPKKK